MTIQKLIQHGIKELQGISSTPELDTELLLAHTLKETREYLFQNPEEKIKKEEKDAFKKYVQRRKKKIPVAHITKRQEFFGIPLYVNKDVLIPRPETEELVEDVIDTYSENPETELILDIGTGSGCIAIALAKSIPTVRLLGFEISEKAIKVAQKNIKDHNLKERVQVIHSNLLTKLPKKDIKTPKIIVANLPYIGTETNNFIAEGVELFEPKEALFGGYDGLDHYRKLLQQIIKKNISFETMFFEIGFSQTEAIEQEILKIFPKASIKILKDLAGFPRTVKISNYLS